MSSNVFVCQIHMCLRLVVPRAACRGQHAAVKWYATNPQLGWNQLRGSIIDLRDRMPLLLSLIVRVPTSIVRTGQGERVHLVVSGSFDFLVTRAPIEGAVYD